MTMEKFIESFHCDRTGHGKRCQACRDSTPRGAKFRASLGALLELPGGFDFDCPFGLPWDYRVDRPTVDICTPHTTWCERYGLPTGEHACEVCTDARAADPEFAQHMRTIGQFYGALACKYRADSGQTEERRCCGGQVKSIPIFECRLTLERAECGRCAQKK
jgi:hypothetical protein